MLSEQKYSNARIPKAYWGITLDTYIEQTSLSTEDLFLIGNYITHLQTHRSEGIGLLLAGVAGTGKSLLACLVLQRAIEEGFSGLFLTMPELIRTHHQLRDLKDAWTIMKDDQAYERWIAKDEALDAVRNTIDFLVLDDVGKEYTTTSGYTEALFDDLFRHRYNLGLPTIITSNVAVPEWEGRYSAAMTDFLGEACFPVLFQGSTLRRRGSS